MMGQIELLQWLKGKPRHLWYTVPEINVMTGWSKGSIGANFKRMRDLRFNELEWKPGTDNRGRSMFFYRYNWRR